VISPPLVWVNVEFLDVFVKVNTNPNLLFLNETEKSMKTVTTMNHLIKY